MLYNVGKKAGTALGGNHRTLQSLEPLCSCSYMAVRFLFTPSLISHKEQTNDRKDDDEQFVIRHAITSASVQHVAEAPPVAPSCLRVYDSRNGAGAQDPLPFILPFTEKQRAIFAKNGAGTARSQTLLF